ncbi:SMI1/KNR4 family protein [Roseateles sp. DXS20W]|uniref:SMI1/KNR4 family protein n=1 Tax=Pelomonas lactea TaxID=3299030 RepID=A0ABW7GG44_9BURK
MPAVIHGGAGPVAEAGVQAAEQILGVRFPPDYRAFLLSLNGGRPQPEGFKIEWAPGQACGEDWRTTAMSWFYCITEERIGNLVRSNRVTFEGRLPRGTLTIGPDAFGNQLLLAFDGPYAGKVLLWIKDHEASDGETPGYDNVGFVADSFADFIQNRLTDKP